MSIVSFILPVGKQYKFISKKPAPACLIDLRSQLKPAKNANQDLDYPLEGRISGDAFVVYRSFDSTLRRLFSPRVNGLVSVDQSETVIRVITAANPSAASLINSSLSTLIGAAIGLVIAIAIVPNMVPRVYAFVWTAVVPLFVAIVSALFSFAFAEGDSKFILKAMAPCFANQPVPDNAALPIKTDANMIKHQLGTGVVSCILFVGIAYMTNSMIEGCWNRGQYEKVESFCRPAVQITEAVLGVNNNIAAPCRYQLAEALRAETPGRFKEAENLYETNLDGKRSYLKNRPFAIANNLFSLGRVQDQTGRHSDADKLYREAIENWEHSSQVGPNGTLLAKGLDRLAMLCLKEHKYAEAETFEKKALDIDTKLGASSSRSIGEDLNDMGLVYDQQENYEEAEKFYEQAAAYKNEHLDPLDYSRATTLHNLAEVEKIRGKMDEYEAHASQAYAIWKKLLRFKANFSPRISSASVEEAAKATELPAGFSEMLTNYSKAVPDPMSCYLRIMRATKSDYELPHTDARFDGLRPYLGRQ
jgi:tetratricopeptide (TPR) repeat protein